MISRLIRKLTPNLKKKELVIFDLDGTLTESKADVGPSMRKTLRELIEKKRVAVIGGGRYRQFQNQLIARLPYPPQILRRLFLFPTCSMAFYRYTRKWNKVYAHILSKSEKEKIFAAFEKTFAEIDYRAPKKIYGEVIEDRDTQITFSAVGQKAPVAVKKEWNKKFDKSVRLRIVRVLQKNLPDFEVRHGGLTSVDVTRKGIDKAYGIYQIEKHLNISLNDMIFVGDALLPGGNDFAARRTGISCIAVSGPRETEKIIRYLIAP